LNEVAPSHCLPQGSDCGRLQQGSASREIGLWLTLQGNKLDTADVRFGSLASFWAPGPDVRYYPESDHDRDLPDSREVKADILTGIRLTSQTA
jgi:hypothetical protein